MKRTTAILISLLVMCNVSFAKKDEEHYLENIRIEKSSVEKDGRKVTVNMELNISESGMKTQHSLKLVPVLVSGDGTIEQTLRPVLVNGRTRNRVLSRMDRLNNLPDSCDLERHNGRSRKDTLVVYSEEVAFEPWMVNGRLDLRGYVTGCVSCSMWDEIMPAGDILVYHEPVFEIAPVMKPEEEIVKRRAERMTARLQYRQGSYEVLPDYKGNRSELDRMQASLDAVRNDRNLAITGISVVGYASPEATVEYNIKLSRSRAIELVKYMKKGNPEVADSLWSADWKGEDWEGFVRELEKNTQLPEHERLMDIALNCSDDKDICEKEIRKVAGKETYEWMLVNVYGPLRRNEYTIDYNVRSLGLEEAKALLHSKPKHLSVAEIQKVADSYGQDSEEYREAMHIAVETYPDNIAARNNAALAEMRAENYGEVIRLLEGTEDASLLNTLGAAYFKTGDFGKAKEAFAMSAEKGYPEAESNLRKLQEALDLLY